jgi:hypothetical protein
MASNVIKMKKKRGTEFYVEAVTHFKPVQRNTYSIKLTKKEIDEYCEVEYDGDSSAWKDPDYIKQYLDAHPHKMKDAVLIEAGETEWEAISNEIDRDSIDWSS